MISPLAAWAVAKRARPAAGRGALPRVDATADTRALRVERAGVRQGIVPPHLCVGCAAK
jgi:hypothetical protein